MEFSEVEHRTGTGITIWGWRGKYAVVGVFRHSAVSGMSGKNPPPVKGVRAFSYGFRWVIQY
jgi:hypothetical protein